METLIILGLLAGIVWLSSVCEWFGLLVIYALALFFGLCALRILVLVTYVVSKALNDMFERMD